MGGIYHDEESHASKSKDSSVGNDASVDAGSGSGVICTLESPNASGQSCTLTSSSFLEENFVCESAGFFQKVQAMQYNVGVCREDIVQCTEHEGLIGMVMKVAGDSDSDSTSSDSEDQDEDESVPEDCARIVWTNLSETTEKINDIEVLDRRFLHGDIVAAASDPSGQTGLVVNVDLMVDLVTLTSATIKNISSRNLQRIRAFAVDDYVIHGPWLGRVDEVVDNVTVIFDDGSKCKLMKADPDRLIPTCKNLLEDAHYPYFPGQHVRGSSSAVFKNARWLCGTWKANRMEGTVSNVEVGSVYVYWIAAANPGYNSQSTTIPAEQQDPKRLKLLSCFSYANWQLGDWCLLPASERRTSEVTLPVTDDMEASLENGTSPFSVSVRAVVSKTETVHAGTPVGNDNSPVQDAGGTTVSAIKQTMHESLDIDIEMLEGNDPLPTSDSQNTTISGLKETTYDSWVTHRKKFRKRVIKRDRRAHKKDDVLDGALFVCNRRTKVDVIWQDSTRTCGVDSRTLIPIDNLGDHDFFPEQYVLEKGSDDDGEASEAGRIGVVKSVDSKERTARVRWLKPVDCPEDARKFDGEEVVSVYELAEHPDYNYFIGDVVIRLSPVSETTEVPGIVNQFVGQTECRDETRPKNVVEMDLYTSKKALKKRQKAELDESLDETNLSWIGNIIGVKDGDIEVAWADGMVSKVGPQAIFVVGRDEDDASIQSNVEEDGEDDAASWETVDSDAVDGLDMDEHEQLEQVSEHTELQTAPDSDHDLADQKNVVQEHIHLQTTADNDCDLADLKNAVQPKEILCQQNEGSLSIPQAAFGFVARIASGLLQFRGSRRMSDTSNLSSQECASQKDNLEEMLDGNEIGNMQKEEMAVDSQDHLSDPNASTQEGITGDTIVMLGKDADEEMKNESECMDGRVGEHNLSLQGGIKSSRGVDLVEVISSKVDMEQTEEDIVPSLSSSTCHDPGHFKHFDSVKDPVGHYYLNETGQHINERKWMKKVQQEWNILEKNLPDTIYVRIYEDRMDLLRAVIVGAAGTPYQDGLFFFDIHFPSEYPDVPPLAYYHSGGLRLNPNLYETGKVCLSLLNTWTGRGNEVWDPTSSSILQVLVSIQGLVLNSKPYFNEAGYDKQIGSAEGEKNSLAYNENSFLLSCKSMLYILRRPPKHFEMFVKEHFQKRGHCILRACDAYMKGAQVGSLLEDCLLPSNARTESENQNTSSAGFKLMLLKIIPKLISALSEIGVECQEFQHSILKESERLCGL